MSDISLSTKKLIQRYQEWHQSLKVKDGVSFIHVDEVASKVAAFYEKIRGIIDWHEENLLRRTAIERILKRRLFLKNFLKENKEEIAGPLILELIRGGHFPNDRIEETKIKKIKELIDKYVFIFKNASQEQSKINLANWILEIAACEIEETLFPCFTARELALIEYMTELMIEKITIREGVLTVGGISQEEKNSQIYIAVQRALFNLDSSIISYNLLKKRYPQWINLPKEELLNVTKNIYLIWNNLEKDLSRPLGNKLYQLCEKHDTPYLLLGDIISENPTKIQEKISSPEALEQLTIDAYTKRANTLKSRFGRTALYATLSIFFTNIFVLYLAEIPFTIYIMQEPFGLIPRLISIFGPTLLMFFLVATIKPPKKENLQQVILEIMKIVYQTQKKDGYEVKSFRKRGFLMNVLTGIFYFLSFCLSYGLIIWVLQKLNLPIATQVTSVIFISLIAFAGIKIKERSKELQIIDEKEGFLHIILDLFSIPIIQMGRWLSIKWKKYNALAVLFKALVDMPFQIFIEFFEQWRYFSKEKKEEIH